MNAEPFDFSTVIELCIRYDGSVMNWNLIRHLKTIEERIIEFFVWKKEYPLYTQMALEIKRDASTGIESQFSPRKSAKGKIIILQAKRCSTSSTNLSFLVEPLLLTNQCMVQD